MGRDLEVFNRDTSRNPGAGGCDFENRGISRKEMENASSNIKSSRKPLRKSSQPQKSMPARCSLSEVQRRRVPIADFAPHHDSPAAKK